MGMKKKANSMKDHHNHVLIPVGNQCLIAVGGVMNSLPSNFCELYEIKTDKWKVLPQLNIARRNHSGCVVGEKTVYIFAGIGEGDAVINSIEWLDLQGDQQWQVIRANNSFSPRSSCLVVEIG